MFIGHLVYVYRPPLVISPTCSNYHKYKKLLPLEYGPLDIQ